MTGDDRGAAVGEALPWAAARRVRYRVEVLEQRPAPGASPNAETPWIRHAVFAAPPGTSWHFASAAALAAAAPGVARALAAGHLRVAAAPPAAGIVYQAELTPDELAITLPAAAVAAVRPCLAPGARVRLRVVESGPAA